MVANKKPEAGRLRGTIATHRYARLTTHRTCVYPDAGCRMSAQRHPDCRAGESSPIRTVTVGAGIAPAPALRLAGSCNCTSPPIGNFTLPRRSRHEHSTVDRGCQGQEQRPSVTWLMRWRTSRVAWRAARPPESIIRRREGGRNAEKNAVAPADRHWHSPGWPTAHVTASLQSVTPAMQIDGGAAVHSIHRAPARTHECRPRRSDRDASQ